MTSPAEACIQHESIASESKCNRNMSARFLLHGRFVVMAVLTGLAIVMPTAAARAAGQHTYRAIASLDGRTVTDVNNHARPNLYAAGSRVRVICQTLGTVAYGSRIWDLTAEGYFVVDRYVKTGYRGFDPTLPRCNHKKLEWASAKRSGRPPLRQCRYTDVDQDVRDLLIGNNCVLPDGMTEDGNRWVYTIWLTTTTPRTAVRAEYVDGCSAPTELQTIKYFGDKDEPFGYTFLPACNVHDLGYRLMDRDLLPETAKDTIDTIFFELLNTICDVEYQDRIDGCRLVAKAYYTAVHLHIRHDN